MISIKNEKSYIDYYKRIQSLKASSDYDGLEEIKDEIYDTDSLSIQQVADLIAEINKSDKDKKESIMTYRIPLTVVESLIKNKDFYNTISEYYTDENTKKVNYEQMSRDLCQAINFTQRMSAVARPMNNVILIGEERISPKQNLVIEFNNRIYDLTNGHYNCIRQRVDELDQRNYDEYDKSNSEDMKVESLSNGYYLIRDLLDRKYIEMLNNR